MALWYLSEKKKEKTKNRKMLDALQQDNSNCVTMWGPDEFEVTKGAWLHDKILAANDLMDRDHHTVMAEVENIEGQFTFDEYREAYTMMELHVQNMTIDKIETCGFVPFVHYF